MRTLLIIFLTFFNNAVFAGSCPDLSSSTTRCRSSSGQTSGNVNQIIRQHVANGVTTYSFTYTDEDSQETVTDTYIADGKSRRDTHVDPNTGITISSTTTVTCGQNALLSHATLFIDGQFLGILDMSITKSGNIVTNAILGMLFGREVSDMVVCQ